MKPHWISEFLMFLKEGAGFFGFWMVTAASVVLLLKGFEKVIDWMCQ